MIGERINPTGRKAFQAQLQAGDLSQLEIDVAEQVAGGADMLDVNVGDPLADEIELMRAAVPLVQGLTDLPLVHRLVGDRGARGRARAPTRARRSSTRSPARTSGSSRSCRSWPATAPR